MNTEVLRKVTSVLQFWGRIFIVDFELHFSVFLCSNNSLFQKNVVIVIEPDVAHYSLLGRSEGKICLLFYNSHLLSLGYSFHQNKKYSKFAGDY